MQKSEGLSCSLQCADGSHAKTKTAFKAKARVYTRLPPSTGSYPENHTGRKPTEPQTPTAMDPEDVATNTLITISTVGKRTPPHTPLLGKSLDKSLSDAGAAGARSALAGTQASALSPPLQPKGIAGFTLRLGCQENDWLIKAAAGPLPYHFKGLTTVPKRPG